MTSSSKLLDQLRGGDRRSIGQSNKVVELVVRKPALFPELIEGLWHSDILIRMRAADAAEKITLRNPDLLTPFRTRLLRLLEQATEQELRWHLAQMVPRLRLSKKERLCTAGVFRRYLDDQSSIVKTSAMQALADLARTDDEMMPETRKLLMRLTEIGTSAMKARGRKLLQQLNSG